MVVEVLSKKGWGGSTLALDFMRRDFVRQFLHKPVKTRPWCWVQIDGSAASDAAFFPPALPYELRRAVAERKLFWIRVSEKSAPGVVQTLLDSGLCEGVMLSGLDQFSRWSSSQVWARRWQLSARRGASHFLWVHEKSESLVGFDVRLEWTAPGVFEIKRGHGFIEGKGKHVVLRRHGNSDQSAA